MKTKIILVTMPDNSKWGVPAKLVAENRAAYWAEIDTGKTSGKEYDRVYRIELEDTLRDRHELIDWAQNNMNWKDVESKASIYEVGEVDYEEGWTNGEKEIIEI